MRKCWSPQGYVRPHRFDVLTRTSRRRHRDNARLSSLLPAGPTVRILPVPLAAVEIPIRYPPHFYSANGRP